MRINAFHVLTANNIRHPGTLFSAWLSRTISPRERVLCAFRARFWLHFWHQHIITMSRQYPDLYSTTRSFISPASFRIFNRLCDTLVLLVIAYARHYPDQPFCPWLLGTEFVEHFFGQARMLLPDFTYAELLKMVQHIMVRQRILLSGNFKENREKQSGVGYILDFDATPLTPEDYRLALVDLTMQDINNLVELGYKEAEMICKDLLKIPVPKLDPVHPIRLARGEASQSKDSTDDDSDDEDVTEEDLYDDGLDDQTDPTVSAVANSAAEGTARLSALCDDYEAVVEEAQTAPPIMPLSVPNHVENSDRPSGIPMDISLHSSLVDARGKISIEAMLQARRKLQAGTTTKSERVVRMDPKFALRRAMDVINPDASDGKKKMSIQEASQRVRVVQALAKDVETEKKVRENRWQTFAKGLRNIIPADGKLHIHFVVRHTHAAFPVLPNVSSRNVNGMFFLKRGSFVIVRNNAARLYIGEVLDMYKLASGNRYGSVKTANTVESLKYLSVRAFLPLMVVRDL